MKEQLVTQLKTQVTDLERFIEFLQGPAEKKCPCECSGTPKPGTASKFSHINHGNSGKRSSSPEPLQLNEKRVRKKLQYNPNKFRLIQPLNKTGKSCSNPSSNGQLDADLRHLTIWMWYRQSFPA